MRFACRLLTILLRFSAGDLALAAGRIGAGRGWETTAHCLPIV